jgi:hypothetical protein
MDTNEFVREAGWQDGCVSHAAHRAASAIAKPAQQKRLGCGDVARKRAARYARRQRIAKPLWALIAVIILVGMIFERRPLPVLSWARRRPLGDDEGAPPMSGSDGVQDVDGLPGPADTDDAMESRPTPQYRPSTRFLAKDMSQVVAFLIRNRGKLDTPVVRAKWDHVDRLSLPLAIYLREIEAIDAWADLEKEISAAPPGAPVMSGAEMPKSMRHRAILRLIPEWVRRGEELLSPAPAGDSTPTPCPDIDGDDDPDIKPRKP